MNTLERNSFTAAWREFGRMLPRPRAVLCISAHWFIKATAVTAMEHPRVIHDFYGFPRELFEFDYPARGSPQLASEIAEMLRPLSAGMDLDSWGLDHGTWSVLAHVFPHADVPVVQLSLHAEEPPEYHIELGRRLAPLRQRGVLIVGSGNVVHNLRHLDWHTPDRAFDWANRFDAHVQRVMTTEPSELASITGHPDYVMAAPTPEHLMPLYYLAGLCDAAGEVAKTFVKGGTMGTLTMTSFVLGVPQEPLTDADGMGASLPAGTSPEQTNI